MNREGAWLHTARLSLGAGLGARGQGLINGGVVWERWAWPGVGAVLGGAQGGGLRRNLA